MCLRYGEIYRSMIHLKIIFSIVRMKSKYMENHMVIKVLINKFSNLSKINAPTVRKKKMKQMDEINHRML